MPSRLLGHRLIEVVACACSLGELARELVSRWFPGVGKASSDEAPCLILARLRHADEHQEYLLIGVDRKGPADGQSDAIDPSRPLSMDVYIVPTSVPHCGV